MDSDNYVKHEIYLLVHGIEFMNSIPHLEKRFPGSYCESFGLGGRIEANERTNTRTVNGTGQGVF